MNTDKNAANNTKPHKEGYDKQSRSFLITINNPIEKGFTNENIIELIHEKFPTRIYWCMVNEIGDAGTPHVHIFVYLSRKRRWSAVMNIFQHQAHLESEVRGTPQQVRAYLRKEGDKHKEKAHTQIEGSFYEEGELPKFNVTGDRNSILSYIEEQIEEGKRPEDIMSQSLILRQFESLIRKAFFAKRFKETPPLREVTVTWHLGESGSGKSYSYVTLCKNNPEEVYYASDFANSCTAMLDTYAAERILFIDEVKIGSFKYEYLLQLLQGYRTPIHARYCNVYSLWDEIHITSIYSAHDIYEGMVDINNRSVDSEYQLLRRISYYVYHWKTDDGVYHEYKIPASEYTSLEDLRQRAMGSDGFVSVDDDDDIPFN